MKRTILRPATTFAVNLSLDEARFVSCLLDKLWHYETNRQPRLVSDFERVALHRHADKMISHITRPKFTPSESVVWSVEIATLANALQPVAGKEPTSRLFQEVENLSPAWLLKATEIASQRRLVEWFVSLWLFIKIDSSTPDQPLAAAIASALPAKSTATNDKLTMLSDDFCAKSLTRKAGFDLSFTSNLAEHLSFNDRTDGSLNIFRHSRMLEHFRISEEGKLFPAGFLEESRKTLRLLFPPFKPGDRKRMLKIQRKQEADIEASIGSFEFLALRSYPYYAERLAEIQRRYDAARPKKLQQWWFDRRNRQEWAALLVALIIFFLTVVFGVIQSVTGILQVARD